LSGQENNRPLGLAIPLDQAREEFEGLFLFQLRIVCCRPIVPRHVDFSSSVVSGNTQICHNEQRQSKCIALFQRHESVAKEKVSCQIGTIKHWHAAIV